MTPEGSIHREQLWAQFRNGAPELIPEPVTEEGEMEGAQEEAPPLSE